MEPWGIRTIESLAANGLRFDTVEYTRGHWSERHAHDIAYIDLVLSGGQNARLTGDEVCRPPGTLALMPVRGGHAMNSVRDTRTFQVAILPSWEGADRIFQGECSLVDLGPTAWGITRMYAEFRRPDDLTALVLEGQFRAFLDEFCGSGENSEHRATWLPKAQEFVKTHALQGFTVSEMAAQIGVDPAHLMRSYLRRYGCTVGEDARKMRLVHACRLLVKEDHSLGEVAVLAGFADQSHLTRTCKQLTGLTPGEYRQSMR